MNTIKDLLKLYKNKNTSSKDVIEHFLNISKKLQPKLNHYITIKEDKELPKNAIPIAHKDIFSTKGLKTTCASKILKNYVPPFNATVVKKLKKNNFYSLGKLNLDAFAHGSTGENSDFGPTLNPYDTKKVAGGSSSGSAVAVSSGSILCATATDTGGSIRTPASFNNVVGIKPTYGLVSRYGINAMTSSTDSIGHITNTVWDNAYVLNFTAGKDIYDATSTNKKIPDYLKNIEVKNTYTIGIPKEYINENIDKDILKLVKEKIEIYKKLGFKFKEVSLKNTEYAVACYYVITPSEVSSNLSRIDGIRFGDVRKYFENEAVRRIAIGNYVLSSGYYDAYYKKAVMVRSTIAQEFTDVFKDVDLLLSPVTPNQTPNTGDVVNDPIKNYLMDALTIPTNMAGLPALSLPAGFIKGMPVGIQLIGPKYSESILYNTGYLLEQETEYYKIKPKIN